MDETLIRIDGLDPETQPNLGHVVAAMYNGNTSMMTVKQILDLFLSYPEFIGKANADEVDAALGTKAPKDSPQLTGSPTAPTPNAGDVSTKLSTTAFVASAIAAALTDPWLFQPIGSFIAQADNIAGASAPPTDKSYRYIKLTAADAYNTGVLVSESISGSAPLVSATAVISLEGSPMDGQTVRLINTERRFLRAGSPGNLENDQFQAHTHQLFMTEYMSAAVAGSTSNLAANVSPYDIYTALDINPNGSNGEPRFGNETRSKNIGVNYYMRIK